MSHLPIKRSFIWGFAGAILAPLGVGLSLIAGGIDGVPAMTGPAFWHKAGLLLLYASTLALTGMLLFGVPLMLVLRYLRLLSWGSILLASALAGLIYFVAISLLSGEMIMPPLGLALSLVSGLGFCLGVWPKHLIRHSV